MAEMTPLERVKYNLKRAEEERATVTALRRLRHKLRLGATARFRRTWTLRADSHRSVVGVIPAAEIPLDAEERRQLELFIDKRIADREGAAARYEQMAVGETGVSG